MNKSKDIVLIEMYDAEEVQMVTEYLCRKQKRHDDLTRKKAYAKEHTLNLILKSYERGE